MPAGAPSQHDVFILKRCTLPASLSLRPPFAFSKRLGRRVVVGMWSRHAQYMCSQLYAV